MTIFRFNNLAISRTAISLLSAFAIAGCSPGSNQQQQQGAEGRSTPENSLRDALRLASEAERKIEPLRASYHAVTASKVAEEEAHLAANMGNYSYTASGVEARIEQENFIRQIRMAGLSQEKALIEAYLPLAQVALNGRKLLTKPKQSDQETREAENSIRSALKKFNVYLEDHQQVSFPKRESSSVSHTDSQSSEKIEAAQRGAEFDGEDIEDVEDQEEMIGAQ